MDETNNNNKNKKPEEFVNEIDESENDVGVGESESSSLSRRSGNGEIGLAERLTDILVDEGEGDLLIDREDRVMQWLQALDMQVIGACRSDERLKPLLKLNVSNGVAEDRLLAQLTQHFEPSEVAMLARCLCIPLVSIRVGKIDKRGNLLCPTSIRGNLTLTLLPTSSLRISFIGDDGQIERLSTLNRNSGSSVEIEEISADKSGRSFVMRIVGCEHLYFWCSEKSKLLGDELLDKLKDLLKNAPSLAELTGISESRLGCFATHLRSYLGGSTMARTRTGSVVIATHPSDLLDAQLSTASSKPSRPRYYGSQGGKPNTVFQASLGPRSSSFKEGLPRNLSTTKGVSKEKFRRRGETHLSFIDNLSTAASPNNSMDESSSNQLKPKLPEFDVNTLSTMPSFLNSLGKSTNAPFIAYQSLHGGSSHVSPYYCWCPPVASNLQYAVAPLQLPISSTESFSFSPLSSVLSTSMPSSLLVAPKTPLNLSEITSLDFPPFLPEPLVRLPLSLPTSQQVVTFTPLMCDPIVHIPCIDICSSGPGYLVSAGPAISTTISTLHPTVVNPLNSTGDSMMMENSARETLRLLLSTSSQNNSQLMSVFPSVLTSAAENRSLLTTTGSSRGLYEGVGDVGSIADSIAAMGLVSLSERSLESSVFHRCPNQSELADQLENKGDSSGTCLDDDGSNFSNMRDD